MFLWVVDDPNKFVLGLDRLDLRLVKRLYHAGLNWKRSESILKFVLILAINCVY